MAAKCHGDVSYGAVLVQDIHKALAGAFQTNHRLVRNHYVLKVAKVDGHAGVHSRAENLVRIIYHHLNLEGVGCGVDGGVQPLYLAVEGAAGDGVHRELYGIALLNLGILAFRYAHEQLYGDYLLHREDGGAHGEHIPLVKVAGGDESGDGAAQDGVFLHVLVVGLAHLVAEIR